MTRGRSRPRPAPGSGSLGIAADAPDRAVKLIAAFRSRYPGPASFADIVHHPVIFREPRSVTRRLVEEELARRDMRIEPVMLVEGREALREAVAHGIGLGIIARAEFNGDRRIRVVPPRDCRSEMVEALVRLTDRPPSRPLDALFAIADDAP